LLRIGKRGMVVDNRVYTTWKGNLRNLLSSVQFCRTTSKTKTADECSEQLLALIVPYLLENFVQQHNKFGINMFRKCHLRSLVKPNELLYGWTLQLIA
jgi:hypothetical protein